VNVSRHTRIAWPQERFLAEPLQMTRAGKLILCLVGVLMAGGFAAAVRAAEEDRPAAKVAGIRQISAKHLTLYTDLPSSPEVDALPDAFDQAFPQWCAYFGVDPQRHAAWHMRGYLMKSREHFQAAGLLSADLPAFATGYARGDQLWLYDQTSVYYRRHLLLHEGTHAFMASLAGGMGPPWFAEGMAELLSTHRWEQGKLTLDYFPPSRDEVPKWGRIEIVEHGYAAGRAMSLPKIFAYGAHAHLENEPYGWCWAAAAFLQGHPRYRARFRELHRLAGAPDFTEQVTKIFAQDGDRLQEDWQLFVANLDYGYDFQRMDVEFEAGRPLPAAGAQVAVAADRGWQASGVQLEAGKKYRLRASGRYEVAQEPHVWQCEPGGVTIRYYRGQPLGILLAAVRGGEGEAEGSSGLLKPIIVGLGTTVQPQQAGTLYLRINDSPGSLDDNRGSLNVEITRE
jgi:hypothetical protein